MPERVSSGVADDTPDTSRTPAGETRDEGRLALRVATRPRDTNSYGTIFGGVILSYIDEAGLVEALHHGACTWVTASFERVDFKAPVHVGDIVTFWTRTARLGTTSVTIEVDVEAERRHSQRRVQVTTASLTMVALDETGRPMPFRRASSHE